MNELSEDQEMQIRVLMTDSDCEDKNKVISIINSYRSQAFIAGAKEMYEAVKMETLLEANCDDTKKQGYCRECFAHNQIKEELDTRAQSYLNKLQNK